MRKSLYESAAIGLILTVNEQCEPICKNFQSLLNGGEKQQQELGYHWNALERLIDRLSPIHKDKEDACRNPMFSLENLAFKDLIKVYNEILKPIVYQCETLCISSEDTEISDLWTAYIQGDRSEGEFLTRLVEVLMYSRQASYDGADIEIQVA